MENIPSKAELDELAATLRYLQMESRGGYSGIALGRSAEILLDRRELCPLRVPAKESEEPKVETLREAARRLGARHMDAQAVHADIAAIVLRRHRRLLELLRDEFVTSDMVSEVGVHALRDELDEVNQMLEGSE